jgi:hypothetical protein
LGLPRTSPDGVLFTTYNVLNLFQDDSAAERERYQQVVDSIRAIGPDILAIQEIRAPDQPAGHARLRRLADDVGLHCGVPRAAGAGNRPAHDQPAHDQAAQDRPAQNQAPQDQAALALGPHGFHCGLLWRDGIEPVPGSLRCHGAGYFWHSLASVTLDVGGVRLRHASHHATPFGRQLRTDQNEVLVALLSGAPTLVGADWNTECADRVRDERSGNWVRYEPGDPYAETEWFDQMLYQCEWDYDELGRRHHRADRRPGDVLWAGGLYDAAAALNAPWRPTVGHHPDDPYGARGVWRRIDGVRVTRPLLTALRAHHVTDTELTRQASDHLPVTVEYIPSALSPA